MSLPITLRPFTAEDLRLLPGGDSPFDDWGPKTRAEVPSTALDRPGGLVIAAADATGDDVLGDVGWHFVQWGPNSASRNPMIGIWLRPEARGRGIGTAAQVALVDLLFRHTNVNRIEAHTDVENHAEQRSLEKAGFTAEGVVRGGQWRDGDFRDGVLYSILRSEWRASRD
ncbi:GNAT family N-acetyltransferase [Nocardioides nematodiphilus]|uniref:GNAT family N-acetyltransferase n=1 Tax=Nocardioides nematodiphilus TaxID=2849669 RepID=UPI001CDA2C9F|nr:GNAT family protein [Nocardioides nematodiphilus]MCA1982039.1 GNAT family N-acetyltransferase [Nocardioides nematodiphilus]